MRHHDPAAPGGIHRRSAATGAARLTGLPPRGAAAGAPGNTRRLAARGCLRRGAFRHWLAPGNRFRPRCESVTLLTWFPAGSGRSESLLTVEGANVTSESAGRGAVAPPHKVVISLAAGDRRRKRWMRSRAPALNALDLMSEGRVFGTPFPQTDP
ncbi:hypothetical protein STBA_39810 [Streptomyces sp. MP131-18]|nr:hypothetical protein STBA_39810 [Streptomyces sp. MP131-18]